MTYFEEFLEEQKAKEVETKRLEEVGRILYILRNNEVSGKDIEVIELALSSEWKRFRKSLEKRI